ncbi:MAG TPA: histidinol-phosphate transaminase [Candidatus Solibacter sp.]|nr:histidinol-phosphate transaminase [Candidatus Solibacter sp.]
MLKVRKCLDKVREYHSPALDPALDLRLDLNESTTGCSPRVLAKMRSLDARTLALYPPREPAEEMVAEFLGIEPSQVLLTNGADEGIDLLCRAYLEPEKEIIVVIPAFNMYEIFAHGAGATVVRVPAGPDFTFPTDKILAAVTPRTRMVVITNPNNPTGIVAARNDIDRVLRAAPEAAVLLDEAYFEFYGETMMDEIGKVPNLFVARTFSKAYGLAGVRLGILAGPAEHISVLRCLTSPFNVNVFALECLSEALADRQFIADYVKQVRGTREWLRHELELLGFHSWPSQTNFVLAKFGELVPAILAAMTAQGIALRNRPDCPGCIRISIGTQEEMERVVSVLKQALAQNPVAQQVTR